MIGLAVAVAVGTLVVGGGLALALRLLPSVRAQLAALALLAVTLPLAAVFLSGWVMFHMGDDVKILAVAAASASVAVGAALLLAALDRGARSGACATPRARSPAATSPSRADEHGPRELAELARVVQHAWPPSSSASSTPGASSWPGRATTCGRRSARSGRCSRRSRTGSPRPEEYLPAINAQVRTLSARVDDLFELAWIDAGALTLELREAELASLVDGCVRTIAPEAARKGVRSRRASPRRARTAPRTRSSGCS